VSAIWAEDGATIRPKVRGLRDATAAAMVKGARELMQVGDHGRALVGQLKRGSWFALAVGAYY
jgi:hypothetical protein